MTTDKAVEVLGRIIMGGGEPCEGSVDDAEKILDALPDLLRADTPAGDDLRMRLGLRWQGVHVLPHLRRLVSDWVPRP